MCSSRRIRAAREYAAEHGVSWQVMRVERNKDNDGDLRYISFSNIFITTYGAKRHIKKLPGVIEVEETDRIEGRFFKFSLNSKVFWLNEDWGDSSVFDVVSEEKNVAELEEIAKHFEKFKYDPISVMFWSIMALFAGRLVYEWLF